MTALTRGRATPQIEGNNRSALLAAAAAIFQGAIVMRNAAGYALNGATATGMVGIGRAEQPGDNAAGANGDASVLYRPGCFRFANSAGGDEITIADIGDACFVVDDQTVARTDGTSTRSPAGMVDNVDTLGVWVRFDEALTKAATV